MKQILRQVVVLLVMATVFSFGASARKYIEAGEFAPGSMLPKVQAALSFAESKPGRKALITLLEKARDGINGKTGTMISG